MAYATRARQICSRALEVCWPWNLAQITNVVLNPLGPLALSRPPQPLGHPRKVRVAIRWP